MEWDAWDWIGGAFAIGINVAVWWLIVWSVVRILHRLGYSGWWAWMLFFWPIGLWMLARADWPAMRRPADA